MSKTTITLPSFGLTDPGADKELFFDDSAGALALQNAGKIGQVLSDTKTDTASISSSTFAAISGLSQAITPSSSSSKCSCTSITTKPLAYKRLKCISGV